MLYGKAQALDGVSLQVREGEFVSVVGLNDAGKTTLLNAISGQVPYTGRILWGGEPLAGGSAAAVARDGIVQCPESHGLFSSIRVRENLDLGGSRLSKAERARLLAWLFGLFPTLESRQAQNAGTLSGGEQ